VDYRSHRQQHPFTAVCYSLNTFLALQEKPECRVILCGGEFHASNAIFKPLNLQDTLSNLCPDIAFYSAAGVNVRQGATCFNLEELPVKHWALSAAQYHVLVVDHSKFGKVRRQEWASWRSLTPSSAIAARMTRLWPTRRRSR
jgi:DeoR family deoxyribose operon repressor